MPEIHELSLAELVAMHNQHAPKPVRKFRDKRTAVARVRAVLPSKPEPLVQRLVALMADRQPRHIEALALTLDTTVAKVRGALGAARNLGYPTTNVAPLTFVLGERREGRAAAQPRCTEGK